MRRYVGLVSLMVAFAAQADSGTLRVGSQVLVVGDSAARVVELLGKPSYKSHAGASSGSRKKGRRGEATTARGEQWQYREGNRTVTVVVVDGRVTAIRDGGR